MISFAKLGKIGPSWWLLVVVTNRRLTLGCRPCSRIKRLIFLAFITSPCWRGADAAIAIAFKGIADRVDGLRDGGVVGRPFRAVV